MIAAAYDAGANSYIPKTANFKDMSQVVSALVKYWLGLNRLPEGLRTGKPGREG